MYTDYPEYGVDCPRCGTNVPEQLTRCPNCGLSLYDPDPDEQPWAQSETPVRELHPALAALFGGFIAGMVAFIFHYTVRLVLPPGAVPAAGRFVLFLAGPMGAFVGAYLAMLLAKRSPTAIGLVVGSLNVVNDILLLSVWVDFTNTSLLQLEFLPAWGTTLLGGLFGAYAYVKMVERITIQELFAPSMDEAVLYQDLLRKVNYNREIVERLVDFERRFAPEASRSTLLQSAIQRWERDNR